MLYPLPLIKYVGGKTQIIDNINIPSVINNYHEPFVGGGSVLLKTLYLKHNKKIVISGNIIASDLNPHLIAMWKHVQSNHIELYQELQKVVAEYKSLPLDAVIKNKKRVKTYVPETLQQALTTQKNYYYWCRKEFNVLRLLSTTPIRCSALFIFLNKTSYRGVYRIGPRGYNVPFGHKEPSEFVSLKHLVEISQLILPVIFKSQDFTVAFDDVKSQDFVYLDPPYAPINSKSFVGYNKEGFNINQHNLLFDLFKYNSTQNVLLLMSNADVEMIHTTFDKFKITPIKCLRRINSKKPESTCMELLVSNI